jgi:hypothetical protein
VTEAVWRALRPGSGPLLLCVDFSQGRARAQAGFHDLAALLPGYQLWGTAESAWQVPGPGPDEVLAALLAARPEGPVAGVLGYCAGGALACGAASQLAADGTAPPVVLFDPAGVSGQTLVDSYRAAVATITTGADDAPPPAGDDLAALAAELGARYTELAGPACAALGVPAAIADQLCDRLRGYLDYLVHSATVGVDPSGPVTVLLSTDCVPGRVRPEWPQVRLPVTQNGLLADPAAARLAEQALAGVALAAADPAR